MLTLSELNLVSLTSVELVEIEGGFLPVVMLICCFALGMSTAMLLN